MIEIVGKYNTAKCFCSTLDELVASQIKAVCDQKAFTKSAIRIMPDVHAGMGCTIGTTMTVKNKVVPGMVGVDIGCGMETVEISEKEIDFDKLDNVIRKNIPSGRDVRSKEHQLNDEIDLAALCCADKMNLCRARKSIGTLGGGNHFIEIDRDDDGHLYFVVHSGSRHLGKEAAEYYQNEGLHAFWGGANHQIEAKIKELKEQRRQSEIQSTIEALKKEHKISISMPKDLAYVEGKLFDEYIHDMKIIQHFAVLNRKAMVDTIITEMGLTPVSQFTTIHNYIDTDKMILRKGAVSAKRGELLLIPINMSDGALICKGRGNKDWNWSAPHGAGRLMSRRQALATLTVEEYEAEMQGIFSTCVLKGTLDESPMAYKTIEEIIEHIGSTAKIIKRIRPVYNFKASE